MPIRETYLAYMRTGFGIAALAGHFKQKWIMFFGLTMIFGSSLQYVLVNNSLNMKEDPNNDTLDKIPLVYVVLSLGALYLQFNK